MEMVLTNIGLLRRTRDSHKSLLILLETTNLSDFASKEQLDTLRLAEVELNKIREEIILKGLKR